MGGRHARRLCPHAVSRQAADVGVLGGQQGRVRGVPGHDATGRRACRSTRRSWTCAASGADRRTPMEIAERLRSEVRDEVGLPITVGVAPTSTSPRWPAPSRSRTACSGVPPARSSSFLHPLPVERLWGVGRITAGEAARPGAHRRSGQVAALGEAVLVELLGRASGRHLHALAHNRDPRPVQSGRRRGSIGTQRALGRRPTTPEELDAILVGPRRPGSRGACAGPAGSDAPSCCGCASTTSRARRGRGTLLRATAQTQAILDRGAGAPRRRDPADRAPGGHTRRASRSRTSRMPDGCSWRFRSTATSGGYALDAALDEVRERFGSAAVTRARAGRPRPGARDADDAGLTRAIWACILPGLGGHRPS